MPLAKDNAIEYWGNKEPMCPHCDHVCEISRNEWHDLYDTQEGDHEVSCPSCDREFTVGVRCEFTFNTDEQPEPEAPPVSI